MHFPKFSLGILLLICGCYSITHVPAPSPTTQPAATDTAGNAVVTTQPTDTQMLVTEHPVTKKVVDTATAVGQVAGAVAASTPPGNPVHDWAMIVAAVSGAVIAGNEMLKKLPLGKGDSNSPPPAK